MNSLFRKPPGATKSTENPLLLKIPSEHRENHSQEDFTNRMLERNYAITQEGVLLLSPLLSDDSICRRFNQKIHRKRTRSLEQKGAETPAAEGAASLGDDGDVVQCEARRVAKRSKIGRAHV